LNWVWVIDAETLADADMRVRQASDCRSCPPSAIFLIQQDERKFWQSANRQ